MYAQKIIDVAFGVLMTGIGGICTYALAKVREVKAVKRGVTALLRDRIVHSYNHYHDKGFCPIYAQESVQALYKEYKALGGNGAVDNLMEKLKQLPTKEKQK